MKKKLAIGSVMVVLAAVAMVVAGGGFKRIREVLNGFKEVPVISTTGTGEFSATISNDESEIRYKLSYKDIEGGSVTQSHIHFGPPNNTGGISVWLCSNLPSPPTPVGIQPCPSVAGTIEGTITAANVVGPVGQGISAGELDELIAAIRAGKTYVNVHSTTWPNGEIRSQIEHGHEGDDGGKK